MATNQVGNKVFNLAVPHITPPVLSAAKLIDQMSIQPLTRFATTKLSSLQAQLNSAGMPRACHSTGWIPSKPGIKLAHGQTLCPLIFPFELAEAQNVQPPLYIHPKKSMQPHEPAIVYYKDTQHLVCSTFLYEPVASYVSRVKLSRKTKHNNITTYSYLHSAIANPTTL